MKTLVAALALASLPAAAHAAEVACIAEANTPDLVADARTVALLTCDELRKRGVDIGPPTDKADGPAWRVSLHRLGSEYLVRLAREGVTGQPDTTEQIRLAQIGDIDRAAPRLAEAATGGRSLERSQEMETVTAAEARPMQKKDGDLMWGLSVYGVGFTGTDELASFGFGGVLAYETAEFGIQATFGGGGAGEGTVDDAQYVHGAIGGRYFFSPSNTSVFAGAGLGGMYLSYKDDNVSLDNGGLNAYGEIGVEFLRLHGSRLSIEARLNAPFFQLTESDNGYDYYYDDEPGVRDDAPEPAYIMPITVGVTYLF